MRLHVALDGRCLAVAFEDDGELEEATGDFGGAEVAELRFELEQVRDKLALGDLCSIVVDQERCKRNTS